MNPRRVERKPIGHHNGCPIFGGFARVRIKPGDVRIIRITRENDELVAGVEVKRNGSIREVDTKDATRVFSIIVTPADVVERLQLNTFYGELEPLTDGA